MADALQDLRSEYADVSKRLTRVAFLSLSILLVAVVAYTRAFAKLRENDVKERVASIQKLINETGRMPDISYVFAWSLNASLSRPDTFGQPGGSPSVSEAELLREAEKLERDAESWFTVRFSLFGSSIEGDLRYWILLLPLFLLCANFYLAVTGEKARVIERIANSHVRLAREGSDPAKPLDHLLFSEVESPYTRYPRRFGSVCYVLVSVGLVAYLVVVSRVVWREWNPRLTGSLVWSASIVVFWVAAYCFWIGKKLRTQADQIVGATHRASPGVQLHHWITSTLGRSRLWAKKAPRVTLSSGLALLSVSLFCQWLGAGVRSTRDSKYFVVEIVGARGSTSPLRSVIYMRVTST